jgi:DNA polymerase I
MDTNAKLPGARCSECTLRDCKVVPPSGPLDARLIVVGEAPGAQEEVEGKPFVGPSGKMLDYALEKAGVNLEEVFRTNVVACRPPNNREPDIMEIDACRERLEMELTLVKAPVLALGRVATQALDMESLDRGQYEEGNGRKVGHTYHPAYLLRQPKDVPVFLYDVNKFVNGMLEKNPKWEDPDVIHIQDINELERILSTAPDGAWVAFDLETDNIKWYKSYDGTPADPILMLQIAWEDTWGIVIDDVMLYDTPGVPEVLERFFTRVQTAGHNVKFDQVFLASHLEVRITSHFDTMLAHAILDENDQHGLKYLTTKYFGIPDYEERLIKQYLNNKNDRYSKIPFESLAKYGVIDVIMVLQFRKLFQKKLEEQGRLEWPFKNVIMRAANTFVDMELRGVQIDVPYMEWARGVLEEEMERVKSGACAMLGLDPRTTNLNSTQQMARIIYDELRMSPPRNKKGKDRSRSTDHAALEPLKGRHPFIDKLLEYRHLAKMKSSYAENLLEALDFEGRVHANIRVEGTEIGRLSYRNPALQTIPRPDDWIGALIRAGFIARPGRVLVIVDYSQAELRVVAVLANEEFLIQAYRDGRDIHGEVAEAMYGPNWTKAQRVQTKMFNFSYIYGGSEYSFAQDAGLPISEAQAFVRKYNSVMPNLAKFRVDQFRLLAEQGYVQSPFGRRRNFEIITKMNFDEARKAAVHAPVAGTASDLTTLSACELNEQGFEVVLTVHDSILLEAPVEDADRIVNYVVEVMQGMGARYLPQVTWKADAEVRDRWCDRPSIYSQQTQST